VVQFDISDFRRRHPEVPFFTSGLRDIPLQGYPAAPTGILPKTNLIQ
jgi:hypothetical protein